MRVSMFLNVGISLPRPNLRVLLMSATLDAECFLKYFSLPQRTEQGETVMVQPPMVVCKAFCYQVHELQLEALGSASIHHCRSAPHRKRPDSAAHETSLCVRCFCR